jgi:hypothetical protein
VHKGVGEGVGSGRVRTAGFFPYGVFLTPWPMIAEVVINVGRGKERGRPRCSQLHRLRGRGMSRSSTIRVQISVEVILLAPSKQTDRRVVEGELAGSALRLCTVPLRETWTRFL